jgi:hypothetical protein
MQNSVPRQKSSVLTKLQDLDGHFPANFPEKYGDIEKMRLADATDLLRGYGPVDLHSPFACTPSFMNVPSPNELQFQQFLRKTKWVAVSILGPEIALATALSQWHIARAMQLELNTLYAKHFGKNLSAATTKKFSMTYCFYAVMGGFVVDVSDIHDELSLATLQPSSIMRLAKKGHFIKKYARKQSRTRAKPDILAKSLVCLQVSWMVIQCIGRRAVGLPISLLEIHVLFHAACALCLYALWINVILLAPSLIQILELTPK